MTKYNIYREKTKQLLKNQLLLPLVWKQIIRTFLKVKAFLVTSLEFQYIAVGVMWNKKKALSWQKKKDRHLLNECVIVRWWHTKRTVRALLLKIQMKEHRFSLKCKILLFSEGTNSKFKTVELNYNMSFLNIKQGKSPLFFRKSYFYSLIPFQSACETCFM